MAGKLTLAARLIAPGQDVMYEQHWGLRKTPFGTDRDAESICRNTVIGIRGCNWLLMGCWLRGRCGSIRRFVQGDAKSFEVSRRPGIGIVAIVSHRVHAERQSVTDNVFWVSSTNLKTESAGMIHGNHGRHGKVSGKS